eukprot:1186455-Prorocentrum_minimum.AAC.2
MGRSPDASRVESSYASECAYEDDSRSNMKSHRCESICMMLVARSARRTTRQGSSLPASLLLFQVQLQDVKYRT